jgi:hypothetical protein
MRNTIKGLVAAFAVMMTGAAPAMACGFGGCSPCAAVSPCATSYAPSYSYSYGCGTCGDGWPHGRLAEPTTQYYYVNQGPTYSGPGSFAPYPAYEENAVPSYGYRHHGHHAYRHHEGYYGGHPLVRRSY